MSSADWMSRNLHRRIETAFPIYDSKLKDEIIDVLNIQLIDNVKGRIMDSTFTNRYQKRKGDKDIQSQVETYRYYKEKIEF